jgi:hypothetical protein
MLSLASGRMNVERRVLLLAAEMFLNWQSPTSCHPHLLLLCPQQRGSVGFEVPNFAEQSIQQSMHTSTKCQCCCGDSGGSSSCALWPAAAVRYFTWASHQHSRGSGVS